MTIFKTNTTKKNSKRKECFDKTRPYLIDIIIELKKQYHTWEIHLTIAVNFMSSKDNEEELNSV